MSRTIAKRFESAVAEHGGEIIETIGSTHSVRFPIDDLDALERIRAALSAEGFEVRYSVVVTPFEGN